MAKYESNVIDNLKDMIARYISVIFHFDTRIVQLEFASWLGLTKNYIIRCIVSTKSKVT